MITVWWVGAACSNIYRELRNHRVSTFIMRNAVAVCFNRRLKPMSTNLLSDPPCMHTTAFTAYLMF